MTDDQNTPLRLSADQQGYCWIPVGKIRVVWPAAQRPARLREVAKIAKNFNPEAFVVILVSQPDAFGVYHCIDGQTRVEAVRRLWGDAEKVPCIVTGVRTAQEAAELFLGVNGDTRSKPTPVLNFLAAVTAGREPQASIDRVVRSLGLEVLQTKNHDGAVACSEALVDITRQHGLDHLRDCLRVIGALWGRDRTAYEVAIVRGVSEFLAAHGAKVNLDRLVRRVQKRYTPGRLIGEARTVREVFGRRMPAAVSALLEGAYDAGARTRLRGDEP